MKKFLYFLLVSLVFVSGCAASAQKGIMDVNSAEQLKIRQMQTRYFDTSDKKMVIESVMATLQDLGFVIDKASFDLGSVSATKLSGYMIKMTVNVAPRGEERITVRANAQYNITPITDPLPYQQFFESLAKSMFLQAHLDE